MRAPKKDPDLFPDDVLLRDRGFVLVSRPPDTQAIWKRDGCEYLQCDALSKARAERNEQLSKLEAAFM